MGRGVGGRGGFARVQRGVEVWGVKGLGGARDVKDWGANSDYMKVSRRLRSFDVNCA